MRKQDIAGDSKQIARFNQTPETTIPLKAMNAPGRMVLRRLAENEEKFNDRKIANSERTAQRRFIETAEQKSIRQATNAQRAAISRLTETDLERQSRQAATAEREALRRLNETPEEKRTRQNANCEREALRRSAETPEETRIRKASNKDRQALRRQIIRSSRFTNSVNKWPKSSLRKAKRLNWSERETRLFISYCIKYKVAGLINAKKYKTIDIFKQVSDKMLQTNYPRHPEPCAIKFKKLRTEYLKVKNLNAVTGYCTSNFIFYNDLTIIMNTKSKANLPVHNNTHQQSRDKIKESGDSTDASDYSNDIGQLFHTDIDIDAKPHQSFYETLMISQDTQHDRQRIMLEGLQKKFLKEQHKMQVEYRQLEERLLKEDEDNFIAKIDNLLAYVYT